MNRIRIALPPVLFFSLITSGYAQQQESGQQPDSVKQEETKHPQDATPAHKTTEANPSRDSRPQEEKPPKPEKPEASKPPREQPKAGQEARQEHGQAERQEENGQVGHGEGAQKRQGSTGGKSARAPDAQFKAKMGHQHSFTVNRVVTQTTIVPNQTQFVYGGYAFVFLDPWPASWMFTDDCYIDYVDDQYFLFNPLHPEVRVSLLFVE